MLPVAPRRPWWELSASAFGHLLVMLLVVLFVSQPTEDDPARADDPETPPAERAAERQLPLYVPPPPDQQPPAPTPTPRVVLPSTPDAAASQAPPATENPREERPNAPPEDQKRDGQREPDDAAATKAETARDAARPTTQRPSLFPRQPVERAEAATQESEARRLFGQTRRADATDDPITVRPFAVGPDGKPQKCEPIPRMARDSAGRAPKGSAVGRILRDNGQPLSGALLQMVGTQYVAFTDEQGEYRFVYDLSLIEDCRTQYVRVSAKGYESRLLVLVIGERTRSDDVELRRNNGFPLGLRRGG